MISDWVAKLLDILYSFTGSWGIAIILFTLLIRAITHPLNKKQAVSMQKMQRLQPQIKVLQEKFKNDKEALNRETMQLYKDHKINPMAGCLPLLVQLPIFILLYQVLIKLVSTAGFSATFLGIDLGGSVYTMVIEACNASTASYIEEAIKGIVDNTGLTIDVINKLITNSGITEEVLNNLIAIAEFTEETLNGLVINMEQTEGIVESIIMSKDLTLDVLKDSVINAGIAEDIINSLVVNTKLTGDVLRDIVFNAGLTEGAMRELASNTGFTKEVIKNLYILKVMPSNSIGMFNVGYAVLNNPAGLVNVNFYLANSLILLANGGLMWYQQKLTSSGNPQMAAMSIMMPILITFICLSLPGGVLLYWGVSSLLAAAQQLLTAKRTKQEMKEKPALYKDKPMGNH
ncbi:MAG: YidC/Oxa1 family membrane protein insertase [Synergistaceae bacterium]|nr:YidC/Oxa1 family membrane protein insertase [Synergistaceae bacterium]